MRQQSHEKRAHCPIGVDPLMALLHDFYDRLRAPLEDGNDRGDPRVGGTAAAAAAGVTIDTDTGARTTTTTATAATAAEVNDQDELSDAEDEEDENEDEERDAPSTSAGASAPPRTERVASQRNGPTATEASEAQDEEEPEDNDEEEEEDDAEQLRRLSGLRSGGSTAHGTSAAQAMRAAARKGTRDMVVVLS